MKGKKKSRDVLAGKRDPVSQLYRAVRRYVEHHKGNLIVVGGIQIMTDPEDLVRGKFSVCVQCLGKQPVYPGKMLTG